MAAPFRFRPSLPITLFVLPALLILIGLGVWQVERLHWKEGLIARIAERAAEAPMPLRDAMKSSFAVCGSAGRLPR